MNYSYHVKNEAGKSLNGTVQASTIDEAVRLLRERNFLIIDVKELGEQRVSGSMMRFMHHVTYSEIVTFTQQLATMIVAGLPLIDSLHLLFTQTKNAGFKLMLEDIITKIRGGEPLSRALAGHPRQFSKLYVSLIEAGERSGKLDTVLERLADNLENQREFRTRVQTAMIYPVIIIIGMLGLSLMMLIFVIPKLTEIYTQFDLELPLPTRILIFVSNFFVHFWWVVIVVFIGIGVWLFSFKKTQGGERLWDRIILSIPIWGTIRQEMVLAEFTRTLSMLIGSGVSILDGLAIVADGIDSVLFADSIRSIAGKVEKGFSMGLLFTSETIFPPIVGQMIAIGEETGKIDETLGRTSHFYESSANEKVKRLTTAIEPIILVVLGIGVAFLVLSIVLPMYQLTEAF